MKFLYLIPARGGSKGIPGKNIRLLAEKPLIYYTIDVVKHLGISDDSICISTDSDEIIEVVEKYPVHVDFKRPSELSGDEADSLGFIKHAVNFYKSQNKFFDALVLLQPTSPFKRAIDIENAVNIFKDNANCIDMVISVCEAHSNPYYNLFEENHEGFLNLSKPGLNLKRRQDAPKVFNQNGAIYVINIKSLENITSLDNLLHIKKAEMPAEFSVDIDTIHDWNYAEYLISRDFISFTNK